MAGAIGKLPSFIESTFTSKHEYDAWIATKPTSVDPSVAKESFCNHFSTTLGLVVTRAYWKHGEDGEVVDVYDSKTGTLHEFKPLRTLAFTDPPEGRQASKLAPLKTALAASGPTTRQTLVAAFEAYKDRPVLGEWDGTDQRWHWCSWQNFGSRAHNVAKGLGHRDLADSNKAVAICAENSVNWLVALCGCILAEVTVVPIHTTRTPEVVELICEDASVGFFFCDEKTRPLVPARVAVTCSLDRQAQTASILQITQLEEQGAASADAPNKPIDENRTLLVVHTSGTTGSPKGVMHVDHVVNQNIRPRRSVLQNEQTDVRFQHAALSTSGSVYQSLRAMLEGGRVAVLRDRASAFDAVKTAGPTKISAVPSWWQSLMMIHKRREDACENDNARRRVQAEAFAALGPRVLFLFCMGAKPMPDVMAWLRDISPDVVSIGDTYSSTELGQITMSKYRPGGDVDRDVIAAGVEVRLKDHGPYLSTSDPPQGEIWVKTRRMTTGYINKPQQTVKAFDEDGFFYTGDIGELYDENKRLRVLDRAAAFFKVRNGEWVSPETVEGVLRRADGIDELMIHGDSSHSAVVALVVSDKPREIVLENLASAAKLSADTKSALRHFEMPKYAHVTAEPWSDTNGLRTHGKLNRPGLRKHFAKELNAMLDEMAADDARPVPLVEEALEIIRAGTDADAWAELATQLTSLVVAQLHARLADEYARRLPVAWLLDRPSLEDLLEHLHGAEIREEAVVAEELQDEVVGFLDAKPPPSTMDGVLLTGVTGHVGAAVLEHLLSETKHQVFCLVRATTAEEAIERTRSNLEQRGYTSALKQMERVHVYRSNLEEEQLGLSDAQLGELAAQVGVIVNAGAWVDHLRSFAMLKRANVDAVQCLLKLAVSGGVRRRLVQVSTTIAAGTARSHASGYAQSKWVADQLVEKAIERGLDAVVAPLGMVGPDLRTGAANTSDWLIRYLRGTAQLHCYYIRPDSSLLLYPVDYCARAICSAIRSPRATYERPKAARLSWKQLMTWAQEWGEKQAPPQPLHAVSVAEWKDELEQLPANSPLAPLKMRYMNGPPSMKVAHGDDENIYTREAIHLCLDRLKAPQSPPQPLKVLPWPEWMPQLLPPREPFPDMEYGIELEFLVPASGGRQKDTSNAEREQTRAEVAEEMGRKITQHLQFHKRGDPLRHQTTTWWKLVDDDTLKSERQFTSVEIVSPILQGKNGLHQSDSVLNAIAALQPEVNKSTGYHVHISALPFIGKVPTDTSDAATKEREDKLSSGGLLAIKKVCVAYLVYEPAFDLMTKLDRQEEVSAWSKSNRAAMKKEHGTSLQDCIERIKNASDLETVVGLFNPKGVGKHKDEPGRNFKLNITNLILGGNSRGHGTIEFRQYHVTFDQAEVRNWVELLQFFVHRVSHPDADFVQAKPDADFVHGLPSPMAGEEPTVSQLWLHLMCKTVQRLHLINYFGDRIFQMDEAARGDAPERRIFRIKTTERKAVLDAVDRYSNTK